MKFQIKRNKIEEIVKLCWTCIFIFGSLCAIKDNSGGKYHKLFWAYFWAVVWMEGCPPEKLWQCYFQWWKKLAALSMFHMSCTFFTISHSQLCLFDQEVFFISTHACKVKKNICWICSNFPSSQWLWRVRKKANQTVLLKLASFLDTY